MRKYLIGAVAGAALMLSVSVAADTLSLVGKKVQGETDVVLNSANGEQGNLDKAIIVDGKSYAPVRGIGEAAGFEVRFENKKVVLTAPAPEVKQDTASQAPKTQTEVVPVIPAPVQIEDAEQTKLSAKAAIESKIIAFVAEKHGQAAKADPSSSYSAEERAAAEARMKEIDAEIAELQRQIADLEK